MACIHHFSNLIIALSRSLHMRFFIYLAVIIPFFAQANTHTVFTDTTSTGRVKTHHFFELGLTVQAGRQFVRTYNNYDHTTDNYNNNLVQFRARYFSFRAGHEVMFKKIVSAGITYGCDLAYEPHDIKAFVPLLLHVSKTVRVNKKCAFLFTERLGYSFYLRNASNDTFEQYPGVIGGFTSETLAGINVYAGKKAAVQFLPGYRLQHLRSKMIFTTGSVLSLPPQITGVSNGFYSFFYFTFGVYF